MVQSQAEGHVSLDSQPDSFCSLSCQGLLSKLWYASSRVLSATLCHSCKQGSCPDLWLATTALGRLSITITSWTARCCISTERRPVVGSSLGSLEHADRAVQGGSPSLGMAC